jgi:hypothetical protein
MTANEGVYETGVASSKEGSLKYIKSYVGRERRNLIYGKRTEHGKDKRKKSELYVPNATRASMDSAFQNINALSNTLWRLKYINCIKYGV